MGKYIRRGEQVGFQSKGDGRKRGQLLRDDTVPLAINTTISLDDSNVFDNPAVSPIHPQPRRVLTLARRSGDKLAHLDERRKDSCALPHPCKPSGLTSNALVTILLCASVHVEAQPEREHSSAPSFELSWQAPLGCPSKEALTHELNELIADSTKTETHVPLRAEGTVVPVVGGFSLTLTLHEKDTSRRRTLDAPSCEELAHAATLVIALALDPSLLTRRSNPEEAKIASIWSGKLSATCTAPSELSTTTILREPCVERAVATPAIPVVVATPKTNQAPESNTLSRYQISLGVVGAYRVLPQVSVGPSLQGAAQFGSLRLELSASSLSAETQASTSGRGANFDLYRLTPRFCWLVAGTNWSVGPCAGFAIGVLSGKGYGLPAVYRKNALWFGPSIGWLVERRVAPSSWVGLSANLEFPAQRDRFELAGETLFRPQLSGSLGVSLAAGWH